MDPAALAMLCLLIGLLLVCAEFFIPSGGLIGVLAAVVIVAALWFAHSAFADSRPALWYAFLALVLVSVPASVMGMFRYIRTTERGQELFLEAPSAADLAPFDEAGRRLNELVGQFGTAVSDLKPSGIARVAGQRLDVVSEGTLVEAGQLIKVLSVRGVFLVVREAAAEEVPDETEPFGPSSAGELGNDRDDDEHDDDNRDDDGDFDDSADVPEKAPLDTTLEPFRDDDEDDAPQHRDDDARVDPFAFDA